MACFAFNDSAAIQGGDFMNRKMLALAISLCLVCAIVAGVAAQTLTNPTSNTVVGTATQPATYGEHGEVILQLPQPSNATNSNMPSHPTTLRLVASSFDDRSSFGASDTLLVLLWIPATDQFVPVAQINSVSDPTLDTHIQALWNGTPIWNPIMHNVIDVNGFSVSREGSLIIANLTVPVTITLPFNLMSGTPNAGWGNLTFVLPPLALTFHPIGSPVPLHEVVKLPSGFTLDINSLMNPAWVRADIPMWIKNSWIECSGHICTDLVQTVVPPTT
jgi:hypothetical protein